MSDVTTGLPLKIYFGSNTGYGSQFETEKELTNIRFERSSQEKLGIFSKLQNGDK